MTNEEKELLVTDLCARLPYGVQGVSSEGNVSPLLMKGEAEWDIITSINYRIKKHGWKPYLRLTSSMTDIEKEDLLNYVCGKESIKLFRKPPCFYFHVTDDGVIAGNDYFYKMIFGKETVTRYVEWMYKHHFNINLHQRLFVVAPEGMYNN